MHIVNIALTLTLTINFKDFMASRKEARCGALLSSCEYFAARITRTLRIMHIMLMVHFRQIINITITLTLAINLRNSIVPVRRLAAQV